jgi:hypothetical protein
MKRIRCARDSIEVISLLDLADGSFSGFQQCLAEIPIALGTARSHHRQIHVIGEIPADVQGPLIAALIC